MSAEEDFLARCHAMVADLRVSDQKKVHQCAAALRAVMDMSGIHGPTALHLIWSELMVKQAGKK